MKRFQIIPLLPLCAMLSGCYAVVLDPSGDVALQQRDLLVESTGLMLLIILPVMALTILFAWRYRQSNKAARYEPDWDHSTGLELVIWGAPLLIIICLGAMTWLGTHLLDPFRPLNTAPTEATAGERAAAKVKPLEVDAVALDWKWLFIYPEQGIASVNELEAPAGRQIAFRITSSTVMNSFFIPALAGQIYAMPGMQTELHTVMSGTGDFQGMSANYSGAGFSGMHFVYHSVADADFQKWVDGVKGAGGSLTRSAYTELAKPSENVAVQHFGDVEAGLFHVILNRCVEPGQMCKSDMAAIDAQGGLGLAGIDQVIPQQTAGATAPFGTRQSYVAGPCRVGEIVEQSAAAEAGDPAPLVGIGLPRPAAAQSLSNMPSVLPASNS